MTPSRGVVLFFYETHPLFCIMTTLLKTFSNHRNCGKLVKTKLCGLCKEERLSELLLLAVEKNIPINHNSVTDILGYMANKKLLL